MHPSYLDDEPDYPSRGSSALAIAVTGLLLVSAAWAVLIAAWLLVRVMPAVLPGTTLSVPLQTPTLERLPGGMAVSSPGPDHPFNQPITIVLMGVDQRPGESELSVRTDSIAVVRLDPATHQATILSLPRDLWVAITLPGSEPYWERINTSYAAGPSQGGSIEAGADQLRRDIANNFGLDVDHYIWLDMSGTRELVDAMGGVDLTIPERLSVPEWRYTEDDATNPRIVSFPAGEHHLSGYEAVAFSRYRGDSDLFRAQRQQLVLRALLADPFSLQVLINPFGAWTAARSTVTSDLSTPRLAGLALLAQRSSDNLELYSLGEDVGGSPTVIPMTTATGAAVLDWNAENVAHWVEQSRATR